MSGQVEVFLREPLVVLQNVSSLLKSNPGYSAGDIEQLLDLHVKGSDLFESIYILDEKGIVRNVGLPAGKQDFRRDIAGINLAHKDFYKRIRLTGKPTWSDTFLSLISGRMSFALSVGVDDRVLVGNCSIALLASFVQRINIEAMLMTIIVDRNGAIIVHPDPVVAARQVSISHLKPVQEGFKVNEGTYRYSFNNDEHIGSVSLIPGPADAYQHIIHTAMYFLGGVIGATLLAVFFTLIKARSFSKPLSEFASRAKIIADGDYDISLATPSYLEDKELTESFLKMADSIRDREHALQESEGRFREIFNAANEAIFIHDSETGQIIDINQTMLKMYGYSREEALRSTINELSFGEPPYSQFEALNFVSKAINEGPQLFEWLARRKNGVLFWVEVALKSTKIGGEGRVLAVVRDVSERKNLEGELIQAQKMEALGTLAGGIAHDFNNILAAIVGYAELARSKVKDDPKLSHYVDGIFNAAFRAGDLVKQILTFSRGTEQKKEPLQMTLIVKETIKMLRSSIPTTIKISKNIRSEGYVYADPTQIHQIIMNLCTNAYHAMRETGGTMGISLRDIKISGDDSLTMEIPQGDYVLLEVNDTGYGIDEETQKKIYEPYFTTKEPGEGTGLGLAVVHGIVESHKGVINVDSSLGKGTTFKVYLPLAEKETENYVFALEKEPLLGGEERIMLVDDEMHILKFTKESLEKYGYHVSTFTNAVQAFQDFQRYPEQYDIVITDMTMPYMIGTELAKKLIEIRSDIPIILCTGYSELVNKEKALAMGITEYLEKPVIMDNLIRIIQKVFSQ
jgi:PAS domain S-box-containing protein